MPNKVMTARLSAKGQLVIPLELREVLKLATGDAVTLTLEGSSLRLQSRKALVSGLIGKYAAPAARSGGERRGA